MPAKVHKAVIACDKHEHAHEIFFIIFVDGIFTTFIARLFTNTSDAIRANPAMSCV